MQQRMFPSLRHGHNTTVVRLPVLVPFIVIGTVQNLTWSFG
jgi:hypothetical protein